MRRFFDIRRSLLPLLLSVVAGGCVHDVAFPTEEETEDKPYVLLRVAIPSENAITRSDPAGGEEGNGREEGVLKEDKIHDINIFFYDDKDGLDGDDNTSLTHIYFNLDDFNDQENTPLKFKDDQPPYFSSKYLELAFSMNDATGTLKEGMKFVAVANAGNLGTSINTLKQLRDIDFASYSSHTWHNYDVTSTTAANMDYFLMSTGYNKEYFDINNHSTGKNTLEAAKDKFIGTTTLERLYARIDLWYNAEDNAGIIADAADNTQIISLMYDVMYDTTDDKLGATANKLKLCNILPVNVMQDPSYLFKKVTNISSTVGTSDDDVSFEWTIADLTSISDFKWAGKETPDNLPTAKPSDLPTNYVIERHTFNKTSDGTGGTPATWYGTTSASQAKVNIKNREKGKVTGFYNMKREAGDYDPQNYNCNRISIISYANENTQATDCFRPEYMTGLIIRALYIPKVIYKSYSRGDNGEDNLTEMTPDEKNSYDTNLSIYRYAPSLGSLGADKPLDERSTLYFSTKETVEAYQKNHPEDNAIITQFEAERDGELGFECYYSLWLRHYNDEQADPQKDYPMEYAIVRNNIYRVALTFSGPGTPEPELRETDTMMSRIFVRKWNQRTEKNPLQF